METLRCESLSGLEHVGDRIIRRFPQSRILCFYGKMGAGKTTLIKAVCEQLGVADIVNSPTFSIINEYRTHSGETIYHMDFYRLKSAGELMDIGYEDYLYSGNYCLIEWPEKFQELLPEDSVYIQIDVDEGSGVRLISF
jgi:tRNA threonylcarbamoyladenosine biosynthesis protein TsaE